MYEHTYSPAMLTDTIMAQITKRHQGPSKTRARFDEGFECLHGVECYMCVLGLSDTCVCWSAKYSICGWTCAGFTECVDED